MYYCVNVVARNHNLAAGAVLIRGLNPEFPEEEVLAMQKF